MRICLVYDCLFPWTVGGAERWYRGLAEELIRAGHEVTYLTRRQWGRDEKPFVPGIRVVAVSAGGALYDAEGRRRVVPPIRFGLGVLRHLLRNRDRYDAVHSGAFPYFALLGARIALAGRRTPIGVDWFEVWSHEYWREYLGRFAGELGYRVQRVCVRLSTRAFVFSDLHAQRLLREGVPALPIKLSGLYAGPLEPPPHAGEGERAPLVVFAGRHIPEKRAELVPGAVAAARERIPGLQGLVLGDGPGRPGVRDAVRAAGAEDYVDVPGFVPNGEVTAALRRATCHVLPSVREGYGLVVIEAASHGTPSVVIAGADN